jgi:hypothetical protein
MWDGREPSLFSQSVDATLGHAQANASPSATQQQQIVNFENGLFTAQRMDNAAKNLDADGATGGPVILQGQLASFFIGINDPLGQNPTGAQFTPNIFNLFQAWDSLSGTGGVNKDRGSMTCLERRAFPAFAGPAMTPQTSAIIPSKRPSISA